ncbi:hypothetical protein ANO11243_021830 [Dothideomycetidae sp. 11243]|nr:hypothetical protein ANO11243_021830 [fungal sp. No.11243]
MTDNLNPTAPSQPTLNDAYTTQGNPASTSAAEDSAAARSSSGGETIDRRHPSSAKHNPTATPSSLGLGARDSSGDAPPSASDSVGRQGENDGEQMAAPGEGKVADAVRRKPGAGGGGAEGFESDLGRKKEEQAASREDVGRRREEDVDVAGALGQSGGPANPVDQGGYPNSGSG